MDQTREVQQQQLNDLQRQRELTKRIEAGGKFLLVVLPIAVGVAWLLWALVTGW